MNLQAEKALVIEQFKLIDDIKLIHAIRNIIDFALENKQDKSDIPEEHKNIVRERIHKYKGKENNYLGWEDIEKNTTL